MSTTDSGYIYCLYNKSFKTNEGEANPDFDEPDTFYQIKIGHTKGSRTPHTRAKELSNATGLPSPFQVVASTRVTYPRDVEKLLHNYFRDRRVSNNREFFWFCKDQFKMIVQLAETYDACIRNYHDSIKTAPYGLWENDPIPEDEFDDEHRPAVSLEDLLAELSSHSDETLFWDDF